MSTTERTKLEAKPRLCERSINNVKVQPIKGCGEKFDKPVRGGDMFAHPYGNICMLAGKNSGKTTVIYNVLKESASPATKVLIFTPTLHQDKSYDAIIKMLEKKGCPVFAQEHFEQDGFNAITEFKNSCGVDSGLPNAQLPDAQTPENIYDCFSCEPEAVTEKPVRKYRDKFVSPECIMVFDDLASSLRNPVLTDFLTRNRHYKTKILIAAHTVTNLLPASWENIDNVLVFKNQPEKRINELAEKCGLVFKEDIGNKSHLNEIYEKAIKGPHDFMYIQRKPGFQFRRNFNIQLL